MLEMAEGAICLSTMDLKIANCVCSADEAEKDSTVCTIQPQNSLFEARKRSQRQCYKVSSGAFTRELTRNV